MTRDEISSSRLAVLLAVYRCRLAGETPTLLRLRRMLGIQHSAIHRQIDWLVRAGLLSKGSARQAATLMPTRTLALTPEAFGRKA